MKIAVCLKDVPDRETRYQVDSSQSWIEETDLTYRINECDEYALEEALKIREGQGAGEVVLVSVGPQRTERALRKGLAMGADRAVLVLDERSKIRSPHPIAAVLAEVLRQEKADLVLVGTQSDDYGYAQTGILLAGLLDLPHSTIVMQIQLEAEQQRVKALREMESGWFEWVRLPLPALLAVQAGISPIRYTSLPGIMAARKKEIRKVELEGLGVDLDSVPQLEVVRLYWPEVSQKAEMLEGDADEVADQLVDKLRKEARVL